ncbi:hypothetical protein [Leisingera sp. ANG-M7]|uniref:hypothetical protein n=1 Tax=Leisingera sp. ANG-M7 TaxID=1577902 RepID=UPI00057C3937|nr:hypothetical protein [Leisingera sp. ANG-M7]KIC39397.1 hypothetical protein RA26_01750 [Leisingera sp. ANG-M7]
MLVQAANAVDGFLDETAGAITHGVQEAANETLDALEAADISMSQTLDEWGIPSRLQIVNQEGALDVRLKTLAESEGDGDLLFGGEVTTKGDALELDIAREPVSSYGRFTSSTAQFLAGMAGASKVTGLKGVMGAFVNGGIADGLVFDPEDPNISSFMQDNEYAIPFLTEALATDPDDSEWMNRMRNVAEGVVAGGLVDTTLKGFQALAKAAKGRQVGGEAGEQMIREAEDLADEAAEEAR